MRRGSWLVLFAAMVAVPLQACVTPTHSKWQLWFFPPEHSYQGYVIVPVGGHKTLEPSFIKGCATKLDMGGPMYFGSRCIDGAERDTKIDVTAATPSDPTLFSVTFTGRKIEVRGLREGHTVLEVTAKNARGLACSNTIGLWTTKPK